MLLRRFEFIVDRGSIGDSLDIEVPEGWKLIPETLQYYPNAGGGKFGLVCLWAEKIG